MHCPINVIWVFIVFKDSFITGQPIKNIACLLLLCLGGLVCTVFMHTEKHLKDSDKNNGVDDLY